MAIQYQGLFGETYLVGEKIAGGGEGAIHKIQGDDFHVAKIFKPERRDQQREMKLCRMVQTRLTEDQLEEVTWPQDVIYSKEGFVGYIMPKLMNTESLTSIYSAGTNSKYDLRWRILAAINLCHAIQTIHNMGQVCGDLNPQNICVNLDMNDKENAFHITLVDTDSYHFTAEGKTYRCEVGLADYIAPEVQKKMIGGMSLRSIPLPTYTKETDLFALAVHIFALLMNGCHPFACAKDVNGALENTMKQMESSDIRDSVAAPQPIENIRDGFFPFYEKRPGITHPVYAPSFDALPAELQNLFVRTFVDGYADPSKRVDTGEWIDVLMKYNASVVCCSKKPSHYYYGHRVKCPLCEVDERMDGMVGPGPVPVPPYSISSESGGGSSSVSGGTAEKRSGRKEFIRWIAVACVIGIILIIAAVVDNSSLTSNHNSDGNYSQVAEPASGGETASSSRDQYMTWIQSAYDALSEGKYDSAVTLSDQALSINGNSRDAYYIKGKALYEKNQLSDSLDALEKGVNISGSAEYEDVNGNVVSNLKELSSEVRAKLEKQRKKKKEDNACLKYGNKIRAKMKSKNYASAVKLMRKGYKTDYVEKRSKIYIQNGKLVNKITKGKGFVYYVLKDYAYIGDFKNGKPSGSGTEAGYPEDTAYGGYYTVKGKFKNGYPNGYCTVHYSKYYKNNSITYKGNYKNGWENGSFQLIDKSLDGGHSDTYSFTSVMGTRKIIERKKGKYVYAKAKSGWYYYTETKYGLKGNSTEHHGKK